ncbi:putative orfan [Tupanvirus soda lake]|uniref:Orfan n=2 Tax=Tupanvirus TaxID=2094720 RepID=A0AC62AC61_9VIRU|nr:putative orfan [Tupanvirus soda lake]QKU35336.1 putative orfan [Tupanvirus soda lake]
MYHLQIDCFYRDPNKYEKDSLEFKNRLEKINELEDELREFIYDESKIRNILEITDFNNVHGIERGFCVVFNDIDIAMNCYEKIKTNIYFIKKSKEYPELKISVTKPFCEWSFNLEEYSFN